MFNKPAGDLPPRMDKQYEYVVEYHPGKTNITDYLLRNPRVCTISSSALAGDEFARTVATCGSSGKGNIQSIQSTTQQQLLYRRAESNTCKNATLTKLRHARQTSWNEADDELAPYMAEEIQHNNALSPFSTRRICSRDAKRKQESGNVIG